MFGYITADTEALSERDRQRFKAYYCGLCRALRRRHGWMGGLTLSYDMTFLAILLSALDEPEAMRQGSERCVNQPFKAHAYFDAPGMDYAADVNIALAFHKCRDNWRDERSVMAAGEGALLEKAYRRARDERPRAVQAIEDWMDRIQSIEASKREEIDPPVNATGEMLGEVFALGGEPVWADALRELGDGLGRFIYFMDAYEDLPRDARRNRYNPLKRLRKREDYEQLCRSALMGMMADTTDAFERLPIITDAELLRNILYSGVWLRYAQLKSRQEGAK